MSWHFSQAAVAAFSEAQSLDGAPSALSKSIPTADAFSWRGRTTESSSRSLSGTTCRHSTADRGEALLTWFLAGFPVSISAPPGKEPVSTETAPASGAKWQESFLRFDPPTSGWKTHQCLFDEDLPESSVTLPQWGMMRDGVLWEPTTPALRTVGNGSGSLPTPKATDADRGGRGDLIQAVRGNPNKHFKMW